MGRDRRVAASVEQGLERADEAHPDSGVVAELDRLRLDVDPLADPDARARQPLGVGDGSLQRGLEDRADARVAFVAELPVEAQRVVRRRRVLHVDPDEPVRRLGGGEHAFDVPLAEVVVELQPEPGRLDADVRVETVPLERVQRSHVLVGDLLRLRCLRDLLAEDVDRSQLPRGVQLCDHPLRIGERRAGDVARGEALDHRAWDGRQSSDEGAVQQAHGAPA